MSTSRLSAAGTVQPLAPIEHGRFGTEQPSRPDLTTQYELPRSDFPPQARREHHQRQFRHVGYPNKVRTGKLIEPFEDTKIAATIKPGAANGKVTVSGIDPGPQR
ncbi:MAG: hypothetical protein JOZ55_10270 [Alphaproteobacteria bacterium]|nr:hypothetical protein [Alphaproteobacteria bacterium]